MKCISKQVVGARRRMLLARGRRRRRGVSDCRICQKEVCVIGSAVLIDVVVRVRSAVRVVGTRIMMFYAGTSTSTSIRLVLATRVETLGRAGAFLINYTSILSAAGGGQANNFRLVQQVRISRFMISCCCVHTTCTCTWCMCTLRVRGMILYLIMIALLVRKRANFSETDFQHSTQKVSTTFLHN